MQLNTKTKISIIKKIIKFNFINLIRKLLRFINNYFIYLSNNNPLTNKPQMTKSYYLNLADDASKKIYKEVDIFEAKSNYKIDQNWIDELALATQVVNKDSEICYAHGRILYSSLRKRIIQLNKEKNVCIFETGTARGFSSLCMAKAIHDSNISGKIITLDQLPHGQLIYWNNIFDHTKGKISRKKLLENWKFLSEQYIIFLTGDSRVLGNSLNFNRVHFAFLDGCHTYEDVFFEFNVIQKHQETDDIIIFDDYTNNYYNQVVKAVDEICDKFMYDKQLIKLNEQRCLLVATKK